VSQDFRVNPEDSQPTDTRISSRKRDTPQMDYEDNEDVMDNVAPAAQAFKKRKLLEEVARKQRGESTPPPAAQISTAEKPMTKKKASKEIDVQEILIRKQAEEAEKAAQELARTEREALQETLEGMSIDEIRHLAIVEEMPVVRKAPPPRVTAHADESDRWEERWNGRKNFKKFRRRGADQNERRVAGRVIVQLEEVKEKDFGIGDEYWLEGDDDSLSQLRKKGRGKDTQETHSQSQARQPKARGKERATHILESEDEDASPDNDEIEPPVPRPAAEPQRGQKLTDKTNESQKLSTQRGSKRPAATALTAPPPAKKPKPAPVVVDASDDSDDDGLKFRFARRR
jgi:nijmegen breakage syndrome protein 1